MGGTARVRQTARLAEWRFYVLAIIINGSSGRLAWPAGKGGGGSGMGGGGEKEMGGGGGGGAGGMGGSGMPGGMRRQTKVEIFFDKLKLNKSRRMMRSRFSMRPMRRPLPSVNNSPRAAP